jgi:hypothetical protein
MKTSHGVSDTIIHKKWWSMIARCDYKCTDSFKNYGGRGITYDPKWRNFKNFFADMGKSYSKGMSLERKDVNGNYTKENCVWIPLAHQQRNRRDTRLIEWKEQKKCCAHWAKETGIHRDTILYRLNAGWTPDQIFTMKPFNGNRPLPSKKVFKNRTEKCSLCDESYQSKGFCKLHYFRWYNENVRKKSKKNL